MSRGTWSTWAMGNSNLGGKWHFVPTDAEVALCGAKVGSYPFSAKPGESAVRRCKRCDQAIDRLLDDAGSHPEAVALARECLALQKQLNGLYQRLRSMGVAQPVSYVTQVRIRDAAARREKA